MKTPEQIATQWLPTFSDMHPHEREERLALRIALAAEIRQAVEAAREEGRREGWEKAKEKAVYLLDNHNIADSSEFEENMDYNPDAFTTEGDAPHVHSF